MPSPQEALRESHNNDGACYFYAWCFDMRGNQVVITGPSKHAATVRGVDAASSTRSSGLTEGSSGGQRGPLT
ncbi:hypothetical protein PIIN_05698 [Serendipita indica DSM 11827]|uniref:Uncharacterized protein n=1 Tax=Serendipita indica (strain DSM 11827) TaxID=1109443 RepID=G4TKC0_SERID|nr:hypothetical protein PIIN_05698 [Serendipita indica DSM 11827]